jgi:hypothetical protein
LQANGLVESYRDGKNRLQLRPTEKGAPFVVVKDTGKKHGDGTPVQQLFWRESILSLVNAEGEC